MILCGTRTGRITSIFGWEVRCNWRRLPFSALKALHRHRWRESSCLKDMIAPRTDGTSSQLKWNFKREWGNRLEAYSNHCKKPINTLCEKWHNWMNKIKRAPLRCANIKKSILITGTHYTKRRLLLQNKNEGLFKCTKMHNPIFCFFMQIFLERWLS